MFSKHEKNILREYTYIVNKTVQHKNIIWTKIGYICQQKVIQHCWWSCVDNDAQKCKMYTKTVLVKLQVWICINFCDTHSINWSNWAIHSLFWNLFSQFVYKDYKLLFKQKKVKFKAHSYLKIQFKAIGGGLGVFACWAWKCCSIQN